MSDDTERGIFITLVVLFALGVAAVVGYNVAKSNVTSDCVRWGGFDRFERSYTCAPVKP